MHKRKPQVKTFDYTRQPTKDGELAQGFGLTGEDFGKLKIQFPTVFMAINPELEPYQSAEAKLKKKEHATQFYDRFPDFCTVPPDWMEWAITKIMTDTRTKVLRSKQHKASKRTKVELTSSDESSKEHKSSKRTKVESRKRHKALKRKKVLESTSSDESSEEHTASKRTKLESTFSDESGKLSEVPRRSTSIVPLLDPKPYCSISPDSDVVFHSTSGEAFVIFTAYNIMDDDRSKVLWDKLAAEAEVWSDSQEFPFNGTLYLTPRPLQHMPIRTQNTLEHAFRGFPPNSKPVFTATKPSASKRADQDDDKQKLDPSTLLDKETSHVHPSFPPYRTSPPPPPVADPIPSPVADPTPSPVADPTPSPVVDPTPSPAGKTSVASTPPVTSIASVASLPTPTTALQDAEAVNRILRSGDGVNPTATAYNKAKGMNLDATAGKKDENKSVDTDTMKPSDRDELDPNTAIKDKPNPAYGQPIYISDDEHLEGRDEHLKGRDENLEGWYKLLEGWDEHLKGRDENLEGWYKLLEGWDEQSEDSDEQSDDEPANAEAQAQMALQAAIDFARSQGSAPTASDKAQKHTIDDWTRTADAYQLKIETLRLGDGEQFVELPEACGYSPTYRPMPHQLVGATETHLMAFGDKQGGFLADYMGLGKTDQVTNTWYKNYRAVLKQANVLRPTDWPRFDRQGWPSEARVRVGATFISASTQGLDAWPKSFVRLFKDSPFIERLPEEWKPMLVLLHSDGKTLCTRFGGHARRLFWNMTAANWAEISPSPDWSAARIAYGHRHPGGSGYTYTTGSTWPSVPGATVLKPTPSSARYIIICTNNSWRTKISCLWSKDGDGKLHGKYQELHQQWVKESVNHTAKRRDMEKAMAQCQGDWVKAITSRKDGFGPLQATRLALHRSKNGDKDGPDVSVPMVVDLLYAAWIVIDELHAAGSATTITYTQIIDPFLKACPPNDQPGVTAVTGSALANGISTVLTFADKALKRKNSKDSPDQAVRQIASLDIIKAHKAWRQVEEHFKKVIAKKASKKKQASAQGLDMSGNIGAMFQLFSHIIQTYFIARDYDSIDPWGRKLCLVNAIHKVTTLPLKHNDYYHGKVKEVEDKIKAVSKTKHKDQLAAWMDNGGIGPKPAPPTMSKADPSMYHIARNLANLPNLLEAIYSWQSKNPTHPPIIGSDCDWGEALGSENKVLQEALATPKTIRNSFLWEIAEDACKGSAKVAHVLRQIERLKTETSPGPHPVFERALKGETVQYRSKYVLVTNIRLTRAIVWCKIVKTYEEGSTVMIGCGKDRTDLIPIWKQFYDPVNNCIEDSCYIMIAGLKTICQSIDLVEGHVLEGMEPHPTNADVLQIGNRQYRIGQLAPIVYVNWLLHEGSVVDTKIANRNAIKNKFGESVRKQTVDDDKGVDDDKSVEDDI